jgi:hypothetical protein
MANDYTVKAKLNDLIDKANNATGESDTDLKSAVNRLVDGYGGFDEGYAQGVEEGKQAEYDAFWDAFQSNGDGRTDYRYKFWYWPDECYNPKYPIYSTKASMTNCFMNARIKSILVTVDCTGTIACDGMFQFASFLTTITLLKVAEHNTFNNAFNGANSLENICVEGVIAGNGFNIQSSTKLNKASITSIINALSANATGLTATFSLAAVKKAFETAEGANDGNTSAEWTTLAATKSNWTISLV